MTERFWRVESSVIGFIIGKGYPYRMRGMHNRVGLDDGGYRSRKIGKVPLAIIIEFGRSRMHPSAE